MFRSRVFSIWFATALGVWLLMFVRFCGVDFLSQHLHYPVIMILGAFVAGLTPEGGGAVAFPALSLFFEVDRAWARDFSLMIQSIGMTSASVYVLTHPQTDRRSFRVLTWLVPICCAGFVAGLRLLQSLPVHLIHTTFLSLITAFAISYALSERRGSEAVPAVVAPMDRVLAGGTALVGGLAASLFGTGADVLMYTLMVTRFRLQEKIATRVSIVLMTSVSLFGFGYRHFVDADLQLDQYRAWLCAWPVVLLMAPLGAAVLHRIHVEWMIRGLVLLNSAQLLYFNLQQPSLSKLALSILLTVILLLVFRPRRRRSGDSARGLSENLRQH